MGLALPRPCRSDHQRVGRVAGVDVGPGQARTAAGLAVRRRGGGSPHAAGRHRRGLVERRHRQRAGPLGRDTLRRGRARTPRGSAGRVALGSFSGSGGDSCRPRDRRRHVPGVRLARGRSAPPAVRAHPACGSWGRVAAGPRRPIGRRGPARDPALRARRHREDRDTRLRHTHRRGRRRPGGQGLPPSAGRVVTDGIAAAFPARKARMGSARRLGPGDRRG